MTLLRDERGDWSTARCGLWAVIVFTFWYIATTGKPDAGVLSWSGTMGVMFGGWAAGSKFATAWGNLGGVAQGIAQARPPYVGMDQSERGDD